MVLEAGRELDALVAEKVIKVEVRHNRVNPSAPYIQIRSTMLDEHGERLKFPLPSYSTQISTAWLIVEKYKNVELKLTAYGVWVCKLGDYLFKNKGSIFEKPTNLVFMAESETAPHAICLAALKAVGALDD